MSNPWRKRKPKKREASDPPRESSVVKLDILREIRHITRLAKSGDARIVRLGGLVLFSTRTGDAWLLDWEDSFAACLCRDGEPQPSPVIDSPTSFGIDWRATFEIEGDAFVVREMAGRTVEILGYPVAEISAACRG